MSEQKKEFNMNEVATLWIKKGKTGTKYLTGKAKDGRRLVGFINGKKGNPKEPDIRLYVQSNEGKSEDDFMSLWVQVSKGGTKYLSGRLDGKWCSGFFNKKCEVDGKTPYFTIYEQEQQTKSETKEAKPKEEFVNIHEWVEKEALPF